MSVMILFTLVLGALSSKIGGWGIRSLMLWISTILFAGRKFGYFIPIKTLFILECVGVSLSFVLALVLRKVDIINMLVFILVRLIFFAVVYYETVTYIYITEEVELDQIDIQ